MADFWGRSTALRIVDGWHVRQHWLDEVSTPVPFDDLCGLTAEFLAARHELEALNLITNGEVRGILSEHDNLDGGTYNWSIEIGIRPGWFARLTAPDQIRSTINEAANFVLNGRKSHSIDEVILSTAAQANPHWREDSNNLLKGRGVNNQGRVRSDNIATIGQDGLLFRSKPEVNFYIALKRTGVVFAPLAVFVQGGESYSRLEPDFILFKDKVSMVVELDGSRFHHETPASAHKRLEPLRDEGVRIERIDSAQCTTPDGARRCVAQILRKLDKFIAQQS